MIWRTRFILLISVLSISIVIFNNLSQLIKTIFIPKTNFYLFMGFIVLTIVVTFYIVYNKKDILNQK
ncbi:MAG: hypothetical protein WC755_09830 [Candidatus Woesearchaeota archaeon]|jgi:hypothetical protein